MDSYVIQITCSQCGESRSKEVQVEKENIQNEALRFLSEVASAHRHDTMGNWKVTWELAG